MRFLTKRTAEGPGAGAMLMQSGGVMENPIPNTVPTPPMQPWIEQRCSGSGFLFALGVVLLVCGGAITDHHHATMLGLALIIFSSLCDW